MLITLLLVNIGFIIGAATRMDIATLGRRLKNVTATLDDYPDYDSEEPRRVSLPSRAVEDSETTANTPPGQAAEKTLRRRPQMRKYTGLQMRQFPDGQQAPPVEVPPVNYGAEKGPYGWRGESAGFVPHQQYEIPNPKQQHANLGPPPEQRVLYSNNAPQQIPAPPQHMPAALQQIPILPQQIPVPPQHVPVPPQHAPASPQHIPASLGYSYAGYIERQAKRYPIMMYTLVQCVPCQKAKHLLAVSYADVAAHFLEFAGHEDWHRQLAVDLIRITGQETFPYIFVCGQNVGGASDLFQLHQSGQLRSTLNNCT